MIKANQPRRHNSPKCVPNGIDVNQMLKDIQVHKSTTIVQDQNPSPQLVEQLLRKLGRIQNSKHHQPTKSNQNLQNIPPISIRIYIYFKQPQNMYKDILYTALKTNLIKFKRFRIIQHEFTDHGGTEPKISDRKITGTSPNTWKCIRIKKTIIIIGLSEKS